MSEKFALWHLLFWQYLKRDWKKILLWVIGLAGFSGGFVSAFEEIAKGQGLAGMYETLKNPAMIAMVGPSPVADVKEYTLGAMYANEMLLFCGLFAAIIAALHVVGHTRKEEDQGLTELIRSYRVGRQANSLAVLLETLVINLLLGLATGLLMASFGADSIDLEGSLLFGFSVALAGIMGGAAALLMAQIFPTSAGATGASLGLIGLAYAVRGGTDVSNVDLSYFNPMGWTYLTHPFTSNDWSLLIWGLLFTLAVAVISFVLEGNRDLNAGYLPEREGRAYAKKSLLSIPGWFTRLNRGAIIGWLVGYLLMGVAYGSIYGDMQSFLEGNQLMKEMFTQAGTSIEASFTGTIMMVLMGLAGILPIAIVNKLYNEESHLRLSQVFSTKVSRGQLYWTAIGLAFIAGLLAILISAYGLGATAVSVMSDHSPMALSDFLAAGLNYLPVISFFAGLAGLALGFAPQLGKAAYAYLGYSFALSYFGGIVDLPKWFLKTSALNWPAKMPTDAFDFGVFALVMGVSVILLFIGFYGYKQRDLHEGA